MAGRPSDFTNDIGDEICTLLISGRSLRSICREDKFPSIGTVLRWVGVNKAFQEQYTCARLDQAETIFDEILDIADNGDNDYMERHGDSEGYQVNGDAIQRSKLRIDTRKWMLGKMKPKKYGEKVELEHSGTVTNRNIEIITKADIDDDIGFIDS